MSDTLFHLCSTKSGVDTDKRRKKTLFFFLTGAFEAPPLSKKKEEPDEGRVWSGRSAVEVAPGVQ